MLSLKRLLLLSTVSVLQLSSPSEAVARTAVPDSVYRQLATDPQKPVWIYLKDSSALPTARATDRRSQTRAVVKHLTSHATSSQASLRAALDKQGIAYKPYWLVNAVLVHANARQLEMLAKRDDVVRMAPNPTISMLSTPVFTASAPGAANGVEWNVQAINAPAVWAQGYKGQGIVVAGADTGVDFTHPAIVRQYRGYTPGSATFSHDYNWFDAIGGQAIPYDDHAHGTFTVGQMVGDDGAGNQIGVAPEATWMACKNMNAAGAGTPESYISCFQWFMAPTDTAGRNPDPSRSPDVINNSWSCPAEEGCDKETLHDIADAVQAAGIMLVFSAGNSGPSCSTVSDPVAMYPGILSVGATDSTSAIASFSSRGPSAYDRSLKPNVSAPGVNVRSAMPNGGYGYMSGTSMAAPEVAAALALLWSADPSRVGDIGGMTDLLELSANPKKAPRCGGNKPDGSNNTYGFGILDVRAALEDMTVSP